MQLHPDVNKSSEAHQQFIEINEAYEVLKDPIRKIRYDRLYAAKMLYREPVKRKKESWNDVVKKAADKGRSKGEKRASQSENKFRRNTSTASFFDGLSSLGEIIVWILDGLSIFI